MGGDGIPTFADPLERAEWLALKLRQDVGLHRGRCGKEPEAGTTECL